MVFAALLQPLVFPACHLQVQLCFWWQLGLGAQVLGEKEPGGNCMNFTWKIRALDVSLVFLL